MKAGRNDPCSCGSGKKYKHCCLAADTAPDPADLEWRRLRQLLDGQPVRLLRFADETFGKAALAEAWEDFTGSIEGPFDPETPHIGVFMPWFYFNWRAEPTDARVEPGVAGGSTVAGAYLQKKGGQLDPRERRYLEAVIDAPFSFHEVVTCQPGRGFVLRDILTGAEHDVTEHMGSANAQRADILFAKVVALDGLAVLDGCSPVLIPPDGKGPILELRRRMRSRGELFAAELLKAHEYDLLDIYYDLAEAILNPAPPELRNTDGDPLCFHKIVYDIDSPQAAFDALKGLTLGADDEELLADAERDAAGALHKAEFSWHRRGNRIHKHWNNTILGRIAIEGATLTVEVNSEKRAQKFQSLAKKLLKGQARYRTTTIESTETMLERATEDSETARIRDREQEELAAQPEVQALLAQELNAHYENWVTEKIPALGGKTPLQAVKDPEGREMVEALLTQQERDARRNFPMPLETLFQRLRARLGLPTSG